MAEREHGIDNRPLRPLELPAECPDCGSKIEFTSAEGIVKVGEVADFGVISLKDVPNEHAIADAKIGDEIHWAIADGHCLDSKCNWKAKTVASRHGPTGTV